MCGKSGHYDGSQWDSDISLMIMSVSNLLLTIYHSMQMAMLLAADLRTSNLPLATYVGVALTFYSLAKSMMLRSADDRELNPVRITYELKWLLLCNNYIGRCCCCLYEWQPTGLRYCLFIVVILLVPVILSLCASSLALLLLAANQYLAICNPLFAQTRVSPGRAGLCIVVAWITSATAAALPALLMLMLHYSDERRACTNYTNSMANKSLEVRYAVFVQR